MSIGIMGSKSLVLIEVQGTRLCAISFHPTLKQLEVQSTEQP